MFWCQCGRPAWGEYAPFYKILVVPLPPSAPPVIQFLASPSIPVCHSISLVSIACSQICHSPGAFSVPVVLQLVPQDVQVGDPLEVLKQPGLAVCTSSPMGNVCLSLGRLDNKLPWAKCHPWAVV